MAGSQLTKNVVIVASLLAAGFLAAWLRYREALGRSSSFSDGTRVLAPDEAEGLRYVVWEAARALAVGGEEGSTVLHAPALSPDGRLLVASVGERGLNADLVVCERLASGGFGPPRPIAGVNTAADELDPAFDGTHLWFASDRRGGAGGLDLWRARRDGTGFAAPERVGGGVNGPHDERGPAPSADGLALVLASDRPGHGGFDLLRATRASEADAWQVDFEDGLCTRHDELDPVLVDGGRALVFASDRPGRGGFDLLRSTWSDGAFAAPDPIDALNGPADERGPSADADGFALVFERAVGATDPDPAIDAIRPGSSVPSEPRGLVRARSRELLRLPGPPVGWLDVVLLATLLLLALLAWLAKRWPGLDVLWKCLLVSLVVHLLLAWWFRHLFVEPETYELPGEGERFRVRLVADAGGARADRMSERGGVLEVARAAPELAAAERRAAEDTTAAPGVRAPDATELALAPAERTALEPERAALDAAPRDARTAREAAVELDDAPEAFRPVVVAAPALALEPASTPASATERAPREVVPSRTRAVPDVVRAAAPGAEARPAPSSALTLERDLAAEALPVPTPDAVARDERGPERAVRPEVALADAPERAERPAAAAAAPELVVAPRALDPDRAAAGSASRPDAGPERRERAADGGARAADVAHAARPAATELARELAPAASPPPPARVQADGSLAERAPETAGAERRVDLSDLPRAGEPERAARPAAATPFDPLASLVPSAAAFERPSAAPRPLERAAVSTVADAPRAEPALEPLAALSLPPEAPPSRPPERALDDAAERWLRTPYRSRAGGEKTRAIELYGGSVETEEAVAGGLAYLASIQTTLGAWGSASVVDDKYGQVAVGKTGLALLAFLGAGHTHGSSSEYSDVVRRGLAFLLAVQDERSGHFGRSSAYGHGIATYAIAECYALTQDPKLRAPLERAVDQVLAHQNRRADERLFGGWSYYYADDRVWDAWPRVSITAWQVMALESARLGGLAVPDMAFDAAREFLANAKDPSRDWYRYSHDPDRLRSGYPTLPASTPAALFALSLLGEDLARPAHRGALTFLMERVPRGYRYTGDDDFVRSGQGNVYFWYYGTLATFRVGGRAWEAWNEAMKETLVPAQEADGSWRPLDIYARSYARDDDRDRSYTTAMCVLSLEVYYRYYLPLLKVR